MSLTDFSKHDIVLCHRRLPTTSTAERVVVVNCDILFCFVNFLGQILAGSPHRKCQVTLTRLLV